MAVAADSTDSSIWGWIAWKSQKQETPIPYRSVAGDAPIRVGLGHLCAVPVPYTTAPRHVYKRISETRHCTLTKCFNGKIFLRSYSGVGTFINGVKVKFLHKATVEEGDVVSLISAEEGPTFIFHRKLPSQLLASNALEHKDGNGVVSDEVLDANVHHQLTLVMKNCGADGEQSTLIDAGCIVTPHSCPENDQ